MMGQSLFKDDIIFVSGNDLTDGPNTPGQPRKTAFQTEGLWAGVTTVIAKDTASQWHHHADHDSVMYVLEGSIRVDWGSKGEKSFVMVPDDFAMFKRGVIHRAQNVEGSDICRFVVVRIGAGETVVNVDKPGPNVIVSA
jgi:uncharacterized RmlC-like cupin family protein